MQAAVIMTSSPVDSRPIAVFDFDKTLVVHDTGELFIKWMIWRHPVRAVVGLVTAPLVFSLFAFRATRGKAVTFFLWLGTLGLSRAQLFAACETFGRAYFGSRHRGQWIEHTVAALQRHAREGHRIVVVTGAPAAWVTFILQPLAVGPVEVIGSTFRAFCGGFIVDQYCAGGNKVRMAMAAGVSPDRWACGYSDSVADLPLLRRCKRRVLINPDAATEARYRLEFGADFEVLRSPGRT